LHRTCGSDPPRAPFSLTPAFRPVQTAGGSRREPFLRGKPLCCLFASGCSMIAVVTNA
jgi:hypothetical protein